MVESATAPMTVGTVISAEFNRSRGMLVANKTLP